MPRATTNKSMRLDEPKKELRRRSVNEGETDEMNRTAGAEGQPQHGRKRPGRAASLMGTSHRTRSQKWRTPTTGSRSRRRGVLAKGSRTRSASERRAR
jgi:hypothetical protein